MGGRWEKGLRKTIERRDEGRGEKKKGRKESKWKVKRLKDETRK